MTEKMAAALLGFIVLVCPTLAIGSLWPGMEGAINGKIEQLYCSSVEGRCK